LTGQREGDLLKPNNGFAIPAMTAMRARRFYVRP